MTTLEINYRSSVAYLYISSKLKKAFILRGYFMLSFKNKIQLIFFIFIAAYAETIPLPINKVIGWPSVGIGIIMGGITGTFFFMHYDKNMQRLWPLVGIVAGSVSGLIAHNAIQAKRNHDLASHSLDIIVPYVCKYSVNKDIKNKIKPVNFADIIGLDAIIVDIKDVVEYFKNPELYKKMGAVLPRGILLEGPPGCGKTMIAKALAHETSCAFLYSSASSFVEMHVGVGAKRIRELFDEARTLKPTIIFIDELDAIGAVSRDSGANEEYRQTLNELLCQMDGFEDSDDIIVIAATNNAKALDVALKRSGRFDRIIKVPLLNESARYALIKHLQHTVTCVKISEKFFKKTAQETEGLTAADIKNIFNEAAILAVREKNAEINELHLNAALQKIMGERKKHLP